MTTDLSVPSLKVISGKSKEKVYPLSTNLVTVGRDEKADICLSGDKAISGFHVEISLLDGHYHLTNLSQNGTLVNDKLEETWALANGDRIRIGAECELEFSDGSKAAPQVSGSMLRNPKMLAFGGVYALAMVALFFFLSDMPVGADKVSSERITAVLTEYSNYLSSAKVPAPDQEARLRAIQPYLRAGFIAEREGNAPEARRIYLKVMDYTKDGRSPAYQYALERLRNVPVGER